MRTYLCACLLIACSNAADPASPDAPAQPTPDAPAGPPLDILRVNEVAAAGDPADWFEIVNATNAPVELSDYCFVDASALAMCAPLPAMQLAPGAYFAIDVTDETNGFKLGGDEELSIYRISDKRLSDRADWDEGQSPGGESFARIPDTSGPFARTNQVTRGAANLGDDPTAPLKILVVNELASDEAPDWIEIANATAAPVQLSDFCVIDSGATPCFQLPNTMLAPGGYIVVDASDEVAGFKLGNDDAVTIKRISDMRISDVADYLAGQAAPAGSSYQRVPTITGDFVPSRAPQTKGTANAP
jgi:hypothetical protein